MLVVALVATACVPDFPDPPTVPPGIVATTPAGGGRAVPRGAEIVIAFSRPMQAASVTIATTPTVAVGPARWLNPSTVAVTPTAPLPAATTISVAVTGTDTGGNDLPAGTAFGFTTAAASNALGAGHPRLYLVGATRTRLASTLAASDPAAVRFREVIDDHLFAGATLISDYRPWWGALLGVLTADARYCTDSVARIDAWVAGEEARIAAGQNPTVAGDSYLHVGDRIGDLALVWDWCFSSTTAAQRTRWAALANQAVSNVWNHTTASWGGRPAPWTGWGSDNPRNNYFLSFVTATVLWGAAAGQENATAASWLTVGRAKVERDLADTHTADTPGGGSLEGTGYGTALKNLWFLHVLWEASTGERWSDLSSSTAGSVGYLLGAIIPTGDLFAPIGDQSRVTEASVTDYQREALLALAEQFRGTGIGRAARNGINASALPLMERPEAWVFDFVYGAADAGTATTLPLTTYTPGVGHVFTRSGTGTTATWLGFLAGPYVESHAHHDVLSLLVAKRGWVVDDAGLHSNSGLIQAEEAHALVMLETASGPLRMQTGGSAHLTALRSRPQYVHMAADVGDVYPGSGVSQDREVVFVPPSTILVADRVDSGTTWLRRRFQLPTPTLPTVGSDGIVRTTTGATTLELRRISPASASVSVQPYTALAGTLGGLQSDFTGGYRTSVVLEGTGRTVMLHVLSLDGAVAAATPMSVATHEGVALTLADGRKVTAWFATAAPGGTLEVLAADGTPQVRTDLTAGVEPPS